MHQQLSLQLVLQLVLQWAYSCTNCCTHCCAHCCISQCANKCAPTATPTSLPTSPLTGAPTNAPTGAPTNTLTPRQEVLPTSGLGYYPQTTLPSAKSSGPPTQATSLVGQWVAGGLVHCLLPWCLVAQPHCHGNTLLGTKASPGRAHT